MSLTRRTQALSTSTLTDQASARVNQPGTASVDEVMAEPERGNALADPVITGADSHNTASGCTEWALLLPPKGWTELQQGYSLIGIVPPRATTAELNHRYVEGGTQPVITTNRVDGTVTFGQTAQHGADPTEQER
jgi:hypothetical protein